MRKDLSTIIYPFVLFCIVIILSSSCNKEDAKTLPTITTSAATKITYTAATSGGNITTDGGSSVIARGVCWSGNHLPTIADSKTENGLGSGSFSCDINELVAGSSYFVRAYATNEVGTSYGNEIEFSTIPKTIKDIDNNVYHTLIIGSQIWLAENLKTTKYRNGDSIPNITDDTKWNNLTSGAYCNYKNDYKNADIYGRLYNWFAVSNSRNIAPEGWHVATLAEWDTLTEYMGGYLIAGGKLKETGSLHWFENNIATNEVGFTALGSGCRSETSFILLRETTYWWTSTEFSVERSWTTGMSYNGNAMGRYYYNKTGGCAVRCVKD
jgi:uncharacterized protein (TIGR02145 family)